MGIPDTVMGLTFVAAGVSIPDILTSLAVAREGTFHSAVMYAQHHNHLHVQVTVTWRRPTPSAVTFLTFSFVWDCPGSFKRPSSVREVSCESSAKVFQSQFLKIHQLLFFKNVL